MARFKMVNGVHVAFTAAEEAARDAEEAADALVAPIRTAKAVFENSVSTQFADFTDRDITVLVALYSEVKTAKAAVAAGATLGSLELPLIDGFNTIFPGQTRLQIATQIENRVQPKLVNAATALAQKIKDGA